MTRVEKEYEFDAPSGRVRLPDLFEGRRQLIVYHHMLKPADPAPCEGCGMFVDQVGHLAHLGSVWTFLDLTPLGRQEEWEDSPAGYPQGAPYGWWRLHDEYDGSPGAA